jgi:hypothetical protein
MKRLTVLVLALALAGCATVNMSTSCPANSTGVGFALAGSTVGNTALSMLGTAAAAGMLAPKAGVPAGTTATMSYRYIPVFGADSGSLTCIQPPQQTVIVTSPPASIVVR